jgi:hypothetical protein
MRCRRHPKKNFADKNENIGPNHKIFEVFCLLSNSPIPTGLICVKIPNTNFSCLGPCEYVN